MNVQYLDWDSRFFGVRIGRVDISSYQELAMLCTKEIELGKQYDLIYVYCQPIVHFEHPNVYLVDEKIIYMKRVTESQPIYANVCVYPVSVPNEDLYRLALISGEFSRFRNDIRFPKSCYERLYSRWIEQAVIGNMADKVFIYQDSNHINGMLTLQWNVHKADIGLVAVDANVQRQGIGSKMIQTVETYLVQNTQVQILRVATQRKNTKACCLYEKNGFTTESITKVYHWWLHDGNH